MNRILTWYVQLFVASPYCPDCKNHMEYDGYMVCAASVMPTTRKKILVFRCTEDDRETHIYPNGEYRSWKDGGLL